MWIVSTAYHIAIHRVFLYMQYFSWNVWHAHKSHARTRHPWQNWWNLQSTSTLFVCLPLNYDKKIQTLCEISSSSEIWNLPVMEPVKRINLISQNCYRSNLTKLFNPTYTDLLVISRTDLLVTHWSTNPTQSSTSNLLFIPHTWICVSRRHLWTLKQIVTLIWSHTLI